MLNDTIHSEIATTTNISLLELLRRGQIYIEPTTEAGAWQSINVLLAHRAAFPARIREAIADVPGRAPTAFLSEVRQAVRAFFFGASDGGDDGDDETARWNGSGEDDAGKSKPPFCWWYGPNSDVDTMEEVETAIRFFPSVLVEWGSHPLFPQRRSYYPISGLLHCSRAMAFIPLLAELGVELGASMAIRKPETAWFRASDRGGLACTMHNVIFQLVCNIVVRDDLNEESSGKLDELSTAIMIRLKDKGLMMKEDIYNLNLTNLLLYNALYRANYQYQRRLRFLIDWDPSILRECGQNKPLLEHFVRRLCTTDDGRVPREARRRFGAILEFGMLHHPTELGFLFHGATFQLACEKFGADTVARTVNDKLFSAVERDCNSRHEITVDKNSISDSDRISLLTLVFAAATNAEISLDGVYTLFHRDPMAFLP